MTEAVGIYLRLSDEDVNQKESNSIKGQREFIYNFIHQNKDLSSLEVREFVDDGFSGTDFFRPGITALLDGVKKGEISCIIVKDFSRFGRNYISVGTYLEEVFPSLGIRFISINDHYDNQKNPGNTQFLSTAFKNLMYDLYSKDLSQKITSVRRIKAQQGSYISPFAPYGYQKAMNQRLEIDAETAPVVKRIFQMALEGFGKVEIARTLNEENVPSPSMLRRRREDGYSCVTVHEKTIWRPSTISTILKDQRYVGDGIYGRVKPIEVGSQKEKKVVQKDWVVVANAHEKIVQRDTFLKVNAMFQSYQKRRNEPPHPLCKKVKCGACNHLISRKASKNKEKGATYRCPTSDVSEIYGCYQQKIEEKTMEDAIYDYLKALVDLEWMDGYEKKTETTLQEKIVEGERDLKKQESELKMLKLQKVHLYESYKQGRIDKDIFSKKKASFEKQCNFIHTLMLEGQKKLEELKGRTMNERGNQKEERALQEFTKELVETFVDMVIIERNGWIKIHWKFNDIFMGGKERI
ncbi:recombinase family protein [Anaerotignum sp.]|uniref:recombinase family protein n=1 Tax=Anaerotignum sp. TaxID=2039241 RepID=UPI003333D1B1